MAEVLLRPRLIKNLRINLGFFIIFRRVFRRVNGGVWKSVGLTEPYEVGYKGYVVDKCG